MIVLLDTCSFLWFTLNAPELSERARGIFQDAENDVYLSVVSSWEICAKFSSGRLHLPEAPGKFIAQRRRSKHIDVLPLDEQAVFQEPKLPRIHSDPFDRMLVCQALINGMTILTPDEHIAQYPVRTVW
jgi:PIN domain nuclease of toxin-antitoxin system